MAKRGILTLPFGINLPRGWGQILGSPKSPPRTYRTPQVSRQEVLPFHVLLEAAPSLFQRRLVPGFAQFPQDQTPQEGV